MVSTGRGPQPNHSAAPGWEHAAPANRGLVAAAYRLIHDKGGNTPTEEKAIADMVEVQPFIHIDDVACTGSVF